MTARAHLSVLVGAVSLLFALAGCDRNSESSRGVRAQEPKPSRELGPDFLKRGHSALVERIGSRAELLEIRARGGSVSFVVLVDGKLQQIDYVESPLPDTTELGVATSTQSGASLPPKQSQDVPAGVPSGSNGVAVGRVYGPESVEMQGEGPLAENLFPVSEINIHGIGQSFPVALRAVDPDYGRVTALVIRRFLPFSTAIRARIYVDSPKMSGSIDTNERGIPLKKR